MAVEEKGPRVRRATSALPESEERVHLYQKPGAEALAELEAKRKRYEAVDEALQTLPCKLRYRALVPLAPGLYAPGTIVDTNDVLVLLGQNYFARMSAHSARNVVRRRITVIDDKLAHVDVGAEEAHTAAEQKFVVTPKKPPPAFVPGFLDAKPAPSSRKPPRSPRAKGSSPTNPKRERTPKAVSFAPGTKEEPPQAPNLRQTTGNTASELLETFDGSVQMAAEHVRQSGLVNIVEEYDANGNLKEVRGVDLPTQPTSSQPNGLIITDDDFYDELCDVSRPQDADDDRPLQREDYLRALLQTEREAKEEEEAEAAQQANEEREHEARNFGAGLAKGFFGAPAPPPKKDENANMPVSLDVWENRTGDGDKRRRRRRAAPTAPTRVFTVGQERNEESDGDDEAPRVSRFMQMHASSRANSK